MRYCDFFRHPRTLNEMKQFFAAMSEDGVIVKIRGRRCPKSLPQAWDDIYRTNMTLRNWKSYRKTQWKG